ncbi:MAG: hypothetical protein K2M00_06590 [Muribaculaceae bacterium]|nr:hypothetical protein [Muribaculaceae bacterium]
MKKFYSLAIAALCGIGTVAAQSATISNGTAVDRQLGVRTANAVEATTIRTTADYDNVEWVELGVGQYLSSVVAGTYSAGTPKPAAVTIYEAKDTKGLYKVEGPWNNVIGGVVNDMIVDATDPNFVIVPRQNTGILDNVDGITYIANAGWILTDDGMTKDEILAQAPQFANVMEEGLIKFAAGTLLLQWPEAPADSQYGTDAEGWYDGDLDGYLALPGVEVKDPWELLSDEATFTERFISPLFGVENLAPYAVSVYRNNETGAYRVENPLKGLYAALEFPETAESPELILDATNPDNVAFAMTSTGINGGSDGVYAYFSEAWYEEIYGEGADALDPEIRITLTEDENTVTFTFPVHCCTVYASGSGKFYYGSPEAGSLVVPVKSGVSSVVVDANAPVEYFNLQGVKVENPANGLYIRRQGNVATKVVLN